MSESKTEAPTHSLRQISYTFVACFKVFSASFTCLSEKEYSPTTKNIEDVRPISRACENTKVSNDRWKFAVLSFSKIFECVMCSCLCDSTVFYKNGVILQKLHLIDYAVLQLLDKTQKTIQDKQLYLRHIYWPVQSPRHCWSQNNT